jgi:3-deoxy-D-manno-octulosonic-acid transferase
VIRTLYSLGIQAYSAVIHAASTSNRKAKLWVEGRRNWQLKLKEAREKNPGELIWFHCASLGEFEQGRSLIEVIRIKYPQKKIFLSFFSPSGYELRKNYQHADHVFYLPLDTPHNAEALIKILQPQACLFVKYEFWFNLINALHRHNIPLVIVSAIFRKDQYFFSWYGGWFIKQLSKIKLFCVQNEESLQMLRSAGVKNVFVTGDTRFDRVISLPQNNSPSFVFSRPSLTIVAGSTWQRDEELLTQFIHSHPEFNYILVPHEPTPSNITSLQKRLPPDAKLFTELNGNNVESNILIVNTIGLLSRMYSQADVVYIGGGFHQGIHNTLEPAAFGKPIVFGPKFKQFREAVEMIENKSAFTINNFEELNSVFQMLLNNAQTRELAGEKNMLFVKSNTGATDKILKLIENHFDINGPQA